MFVVTLSCVVLGAGVVASQSHAIAPVVIATNQGLFGVHCNIIPTII